MSTESPMWPGRRIAKSKFPNFVRSRCLPLNEALDVVKCLVESWFAGSQDTFRWWSHALAYWVCTVLAIELAANVQSTMYNGETWASAAAFKPQNRLPYLYCVGGDVKSIYQSRSQQGNIDKQVPTKTEALSGIKTRNRLDIAVINNISAAACCAISDWRRVFAVPADCLTMSCRRDSQIPHTTAASTSFCRGPGLHSCIVLYCIKIFNVV